MAQHGAHNSAHSLMGRKRGMTQLFDKNGNAMVCTVIEAEPNRVTQLKTVAKDGYEAIQCAFDEIRVKDARTVAKRASKPRRGHFEKAGVAPCYHLFETRVEDSSAYSLGQALDVTLFDGVLYVDVVGTSKGRGYQGVIRKYGFAGGPASHGSGFHRHAGSTGMRSSPGRCLPDGPRPSHMGDERVTVQSLRVVAIDKERNLLIVEGAVPGARNSVVLVRSAKKQKKKRA